MIYLGDLGNKEIMSKNIKYYMDLTHKDRNQICSDLNIKYSTLTDWINGNVYPRIDKIELLANYFGINKSDLVEERGTELEDDDVIIINRAAKKMTPEGRKQLIAMVKVMFKEDFFNND